MPSSGARSGTKPKRPTRGGDGKVGQFPLDCGHDVDRLEEVAIYPGGRRIYRCSTCKQLAERRR